MSAESSSIGIHLEPTGHALEALEFLTEGKHLDDTPINKRKYIEKDEDPDQEASRRELFHPHKVGVTSFNFSWRSNPIAAEEGVELNSCRKLEELFKNHDEGRLVSWLGAEGRTNIMQRNYKPEEGSGIVCQGGILVEDITESFHNGRINTAFWIEPYDDFRGSVDYFINRLRHTAEYEYFLNWMRLHAPAQGDEIGSVRMGGNAERALGEALYKAEEETVLDIHIRALEPGSNFYEEVNTANPEDMERLHDNVFSIRADGDKVEVRSGADQEAVHPVIEALEEYGFEIHSETLRGDNNTAELDYKQPVTSLTPAHKALKEEGFYRQSVTLRKT